MNKGDLMRFTYHGNTTGIDSALPKEYWSHMDTFWWCMNYQEVHYGQLNNMAERCFKENRIPDIDLGIETGDIITIFGINGFCMTTQTTGKVVNVLHDRIDFKIGRKRKMYSIKIFNPEIMVFKDYPPFNADSESKTPEGNQIMRGNCMYNLVTDLERNKLKEYITKEALWPMSQDNMARIIHMNPLENTPDNKLYADNIVFPLFYSHSQIALEIKSRERDHIPGI